MSTAPTPEAFLPGTPSLRSFRRRSRVSATHGTVRPQHRAECNCRTWTAIVRIMLVRPCQVDVLPSSGVMAPFHLVHVIQLVVARMMSNCSVSRLLMLQGNRESCESGVECQITFGGKSTTFRLSECSAESMNTTCSNITSSKPGAIRNGIVTGSCNDGDFPRLQESMAHEKAQTDNPH
jgi:hypothetical protein